MNVCSLLLLSIFTVFLSTRILVASQSQHSEERGGLCPVSCQPCTVCFALGGAALCQYANNHLDMERMRCGCNARHCGVRAHLAWAIPTRASSLLAWPLHPHRFGTLLLHRYTQVLRIRSTPWVLHWRRVFNLATLFCSSVGELLSLNGTNISQKKETAFMTSKVEPCFTSPTNWAPSTRSHGSPLLGGYSCS